MNYPNLLELLKLNEHTHLDFKVQYGTKVDLVHDILCMANVLGETPRFIVFGINDKKGIVGLTGTLYRSNDIIDTLKNAGLNFMPQIELHNCPCPGNKTVQILKILGDAFKPYWLLKDYSFQAKTIRAGAIYCRLGDRNVATNESTPEKLVEAMFRERFGLDKSPLQRLKTYVKDTKNWKYDTDVNGSFYYYDLFPEFTIREIDRNNDMQFFFEPWTLLFPDQQSYRDEYEVRYHSTKLLTYYQISCDGGRFNTVMPETKTFKRGQALLQAFFFDRSKIQFDIGQMIQEVTPNIDDRSLERELPIFTSRLSGEKTFEADLKKQINTLCFFVFDQETQTYCTLKKGVKKQIALGPSAPVHLKNR